MLQLSLHSIYFKLETEMPFQSLSVFLYIFFHFPNTTRSTDTQTLTFHDQLFLLNNQESHVKCQKRIKTEVAITTLPLFCTLLDIDPFYSRFKRCYIKGSSSLFSHYIRFNGDCILLKTITTFHASQITTSSQKINSQINEEQNILGHSNTDHNCQQW